MDTGNFYQQYQPRTSPQNSHSTIPDFSSTSSGRRHHSANDFGSKLDQLLYVMEQQKSYTVEIKEQVSELKKEMDNFKTEMYSRSISSSSSAEASSSPRPKIPAKLLVSFNLLY